MSPWKITIMIVAQTLVSLVLFAGVIAILVFLLRKRMRRYKHIDMGIFDKLKPHVTPARNRLMLFITFLGKHHFLIPANLILIIYFLFIAHQNWFTIRVVTIALSSLVLMLLLKNLFRRKRPLSPLLNAAKGLSFPSGHAIMAVTFYGLVFYIVWHEVSIDWIRLVICFLLLVLILWIGYTRIYLRVHYASDVLAGFIIGLLWLLISLGVLAGVEEYVREMKLDV